MRPDLDEIDVQALIMMTKVAPQALAVQVLEVDTPALVSRKVGGEIVLGRGRPFANRGDILSDLSGQPLDVTGIPWVVSGAAAASGAGLER